MAQTSQSNTFKAESSGHIAVNGVTRPNKIEAAEEAKRIKHDQTEDNKDPELASSSQTKKIFSKWKEFVPHKASSAITNYKPVLVIMLVAFLAALATYFRTSEGIQLMPQFMGMILILFSMLKLFDIKGFKQGFAQYDLISMRWTKYAYWYPTFELILGLGFLSGYFLALFSLATILMMSVTAVGVLLALVNRKDIDCACTGALIQVPLSSISLIESVGMVVMAVAMLAQSI